MEASGLSISPLISTSCNTNPHYNNLRFNKTHLFNSSLITHKPLQFQSTLKWVVKAQAADEDYELKQVKDMAAARKRWDALVGGYVREGKVKVLTPKEAGYAIQLSGKTLLDVRPSTEHEKVNVQCC
ncbi:putative Rhodanese-like domain-containing protein [Helianthus annuus]|nr:putative Rhodanese-like domain-containing protein [Helianthus annuus]